jgi:hypothetical protein
MLSCHEPHAAHSRWIPAARPISPLLRLVAALREVYRRYSNWVAPTRTRFALHELGWRRTRQVGTKSTWHRAARNRLSEFQVGIGATRTGLAISKTGWHQIDLESRYTRQKRSARRPFARFFGRGDRRRRFADFPLGAVRSRQRQSDEDEIAFSRALAIAPVHAPATAALRGEVSRAAGAWKKPRRCSACHERGST